MNVPRWEGIVDMGRQDGIRVVGLRRISLRTRPDAAEFRDGKPNT